MFYSWRIKSSKNFLRNHAVPGLFFKNCSGDEVGSKNIFKNTPCLSTHNLTDSVNHGMVKNTKAWISWEWNINFLWNKKNLNLCRRWNILRSCRFVNFLLWSIYPSMIIHHEQLQYIWLSGTGRKNFQQLKINWTNFISTTWLH